jgi:hypothetical protein
LNGEALTPVVCARCGTLYHKQCWEQSGRCAILGCGHDKYIVHGRDLGPAIKVKYTDLPAPSANGREPSRQTKRLKEQQRRQVEQLRRPTLLQRLWKWLLDQIRING